MRILGEGQEDFHVLPEASITSSVRCGGAGKGPAEWGPSAMFALFGLVGLERER